MSARSFVDSLESRRFLSADALIPPDAQPPEDLDPVAFQTTAVAVTGPSLTKGKLTVVGTANTDTVTLALESNNTKIAVTFNGTKTTYDLSAVKKIDLQGGAGNDTLTVNFANLSAAAAKKLSLRISGDGGNDTITTNLRGELRGGDGNDVITGSAGVDKIFGDAGNDTIVSGGSKDSISDRFGTNRISFANGDQVVGDMTLKTDKKGVLTITGSKAADKFAFAKGTGSNVTVTLNGQTAVFDLSKATAVKLDGGAGRDEVTVAANTFGTKTFTKKSIEVG